MTKEQIKAAIAANLAGQGSMIDISGQLPAILDAIVDAIPASYELPVASADVLGGVKVGEGLAIAEDGKLSAEGGGGNEPLVVEGEWESAGNTFTPNEGQPSFMDVAAAFESGTLVLLRFGDGDTGTTITAQVISYGFDGAETFLYAPFAIGVGDESKAYWATMEV